MLFHPYLLGSQHGPQAGGGFLGLHDWHDRGDLVRGVIEGIAFNHHIHDDALLRRMAEILSVELGRSDESCEFEFRATRNGPAGRHRIVFAEG